PLGPRGGNKGLVEGLISVGYLPVAVDESNPWIQLYKKINPSHNGNAPFDNNIVCGSTGGDLTLQALQNARKNLTREGSVAAIEKGGFKNPAAGPYRYSKTNHS